MREKGIVQEGEERAPGEGPKGKEAACGERRDEHDSGEQEQEGEGLGFVADAAAPAAAFGHCESCGRALRKIIAPAHKSVPGLSVGSRCMRGVSPRLVSGALGVEATRIPRGCVGLP